MWNYSAAPADTRLLHKATLHVSARAGAEVQNLQTAPRLGTAQRASSGPCTTHPKKSTPTCWARARRRTHCMHNKGCILIQGEAGVMGTDQHHPHAPIHSGRHAGIRTVTRMVQHHAWLLLSRFHNTQLAQSHPSRTHLEPPRQPARPWPLPANKRAVQAHTQVGGQVWAACLLQTALPNLNALAPMDWRVTRHEAAAASHTQA